jgi:hypothetical protein
MSSTIQHPVQRAYDVATNAYVAACTVLEARTQDLDWEADFDAAFEAEEAVRSELGMDALRCAVSEAETALVKWSAKVATEVAPVPSEVIALYDRALTDVVVRKRVVDLAMRIAA